MWADAVLLSVSAICVATDLKSRKIHNKIIFPSLILAVAAHSAAGGWTGLTQSLLGFAAGLGILLIPYLLGGMGAGDVKMLALVGALKGAAFVLAASVYMALIGGLLAAGVLLFRDGVRNRLRRIGLMLLCLQLRIVPPIGGKDAAGTAGCPYGVAIAGGAAVCLALKGWGAA